MGAESDGNHDRLASAARQGRHRNGQPGVSAPLGACVTRLAAQWQVYHDEMMPEHARWFAGSAEGLADTDAAAERLPRAEGPRGRRLGVRVQRVARKGRFAPPGLAGSCATAGRLAGSRASPRRPCAIRVGRAGRARPGAPPAGARRARRGSTGGPGVAGRKEPQGVGRPTRRWRKKSDSPYPRSNRHLYVSRITVSLCCR